MTRIDINTGNGGSTGFASTPVHGIVESVRRLLSEHRIDRMRRRTQRELNGLPGIVRRDVGVAETVRIKSNELSHQFYSLD